MEKKLVVGKMYSKIPVNIRTKNLRTVCWRGSIANNCDDMEIIAKYDNSYNLETLIIEYKKPSLKSSLFKSMTITYLSNGEKMISTTSYLGAQKNMTEQEYGSTVGANAVSNLEILEKTYSNNRCTATVHL